VSTHTVPTVSPVVPPAVLAAAVLAPAVLAPAVLAPAVAPPVRPDVVAVLTDPRLDEIRRRLDDLLTRSFYSGAGYVFESDPYVVAEDADVLEKLTVIREQDRRHAHVLATLIAARGGVPSPGVFPWWNLDLNFLTVPTVAVFVVGSLREELGLFDTLIAHWPADDEEGRAALRVIRAEKARQVDDLAPAVVAAQAREAETHVAKAASVKKTRDARVAKQKAAAEAAKKAKAVVGKPGASPAAAAAAPVAAAASAEIGDPAEPGINKKEKGRRALLRIRKKLGLPMSLLAGKSAPAPASPGAVAPAAAPVAAAAPAAPAAAVLLDPGEPGISPKEKAKRQMLKVRAASGAPAPATAPAPVPPSAPAPAPADAATALLDPNEPGISPKEKAKRQMLKLRAASGAVASGAPSAPVAAATAPAPAAAPAVESLPADLGDPNEAGISPKEKARRQMARMRAQRG